MKRIQLSYDICDTEKNHIIGEIYKMHQSQEKLQFPEIIGYMKKEKNWYKY